MSSKDGITNLEDKLAQVISAVRKENKNDFEKTLAEIKKEFDKNLEEKNKGFTGTFKAVSSQIDAQLALAKEALNKAVKISEETGIPFASTISDVGECRKYIPSTFEEKWSSFDTSELLEEIGVYSTYDTGWEYWNTSSLTC